jgi:hypothetical protein
VRFFLGLPFVFIGLGIAWIGAAIMGHKALDDFIEPAVAGRRDWPNA